MCWKGNFGKSSYTKRCHQSVFSPKIVIITIKQDTAVDIFCILRACLNWKKEIDRNDGLFCVVLIHVLTWTSFRICRRSEVIPVKWLISMCLFILVGWPSFPHLADTSFAILFSHIDQVSSEFHLGFDLLLEFQIKCLVNDCHNHFWRLERHTSLS